jgi:hypothetical protein
MTGILLSGHFSALCIWPFIFIKPDNTIRNFQSFMNHEKIHARQQIEMLWILFFIGYVVEYLIRLYQYRDHMKAYHAISFEKEAYQNENDPEYLKTRKSFAWRMYL